ncbi:MAG: CDP-alcohol phosphatidyltransferase family protein [Desulfobacteraceae bacterium]|nr:CDP-alcohol phosphatidyltransferase family protein [Desulfobacteraceae bacterium]
MTIPNLLTIARILLTPVLVWLLLNDRLTAAMVVFFIAGLSDGLDGFLARVFNQHSRLGAYLDPLADKFLLVTSFVLLGYTGLMPVWLVIITVGRDLMILLGIFTLYHYRVNVEIKPLLSSKLTTLCQLAAIFAMLASSLIRLPDFMYTALFLVTAGFSVYSGARYFAVGKSLLDKHRCAGTG